MNFNGKTFAVLLLCDGYFVESRESEGREILLFWGILIEKSLLGKHLVSHILLLMANTRRMQIIFWAFRNPVFSTLFLFYIFLNSGHIDLIPSFIF